MKTDSTRERIVKVKENGVTVFKIIGYEDDPHGYKSTYLQLVEEIKKNMYHFVSNGESIPVVRSRQSIEIH